MMAGILDKWFVSKIWPMARRARCDDRKCELIKRADVDELREVFNRHASITSCDDGEKLMTYSDFIHNYLGLMPRENYDPNTLLLLASTVDTTRDQQISFSEFQAFEALLCLPDAMYTLAFQIFDRNGNGFITFDEFQSTIKHSTLNSKIPFDFNSDFIQLHFGKEKSRNITYNEFTQLIHDFNDEYAWQAFRRLDKGETGSITAKDFEDIMISLKSYLLTPFSRENLITVAVGGERHRQISYAYFTAFISLLNNVELVRRIYLAATRRDTSRGVTKEELLYQAQAQSTQITPLEIDILFQLANIKHQTGLLQFSDLDDISMEGSKDTPFKIQMQIAEHKIRLEQGATNRSTLQAVSEQVYRFTLGAVAGATGATAVYPIDLVKTRLQNQRSGSYIGELMYKNSIDCFKKVFRHEGFRGLYRGLAPQIVGVAPEKAIKLTMNDLLRDKLVRRDGTLPLWAECSAGGIAGASQVMFTNPLEIVKIRLQVAGEIMGKSKVSALRVMKDLGFFGLYKGARACLLRDVPFSAIYFPAYAHVKKFFADDNGYNSPGTLLLSAAIAGIPAAFLPTPADVIKTRLQVAERAGQTTYDGILDCCRKISQQEGLSAFWKGSAARVCRSSPQFGVTLLTYELLQRTLYADFGGSRPEGSEAKSVHMEDVLSRNPDHIGGYRLALATFDGIETKFGLVFPKFKSSTSTAPQ